MLSPRVWGVDVREPDHGRRARHDRDELVRREMLDGTGRESRHRQHRPVDGGRRSRDCRRRARAPRPVCSFTRESMRTNYKRVRMGRRHRDVRLVLGLLVGLICAACGWRRAFTERPHRHLRHRRQLPAADDHRHIQRAAVARPTPARSCTHAALDYAHSTGLPGPADLYYYDLRESYAHAQADGCT